MLPPSRISPYPLIPWFVSSRRMYELDYVRTKLNGNLRTGKEFLTIDIQCGSDG